MFSLYSVAGGVAFCAFLVGLVILFSRKLGEADAKIRERKRAIEIQRRLAKILARRDRTRDELSSWMRDDDD